MSSDIVSDKDVVVVVSYNKLDGQLDEERQKGPDLEWHHDKHQHNHENTTNHTNHKQDKDHLRESHGGLRAVVLPPLPIDQSHVALKCNEWRDDQCWNNSNSKKELEEGDQTQDGADPAEHGKDLDSDLQWEA